MVAVSLLFGLSTQDPEGSEHRGERLLPEFYSVNISIQSGETQHVSLSFSSAQAADRVAMAFCMRNRCIGAQMQQVEYLVAGVQSGAVANVSANLRALRSDDWFAFFHRVEGFTELVSLPWPKVVSAGSHGHEISIESTRRFCEAHRCSEYSGLQRCCTMLLGNLALAEAHEPPPPPEAMQSAPVSKTPRPQPAFHGPP